MGGGAITDLGGFVASTFMRGMNLIHIPTTLLAMVDASIGGKTGIDFGGLKNSVGTFYSPKKVWVSLAFLETLDRNNLLSGYGEILKYGLLIGKDYLCSINTEEEITPLMLQTAIQYKIDVVTSDFEDMGERMHLNLGHTSAHALEALYISRGEFLPHGVAVSAGLVVALYLSYRRYGLEQGVLTSFARQVQSIMPVVYFTCDDYDDLWQLTLKDKKRLSSNELTMVLLHDIGQPFIHNVSRHDFFEALDFYRDFMGF